MKSQRLALTRALPITLIAVLGAGSVGAMPRFSTPGSAVAPAMDKSEAAVNDDIAFAKGLAKEWGFVDLASEIIKRIEKDGVKPAIAERLGVVKCEIYGQGAIAERDHERRNELFEQALEAYEEFLKDNPNSPAAPEARSGYITISTTFARALQISLEESIGEAAEAFRLRREEVLLGANILTDDLILELKEAYESTKEPSELMKRELANMMMKRAQINLQMGKSAESGIALYQTARTILEEVVFLVGDGTPGALRAYDMIGQVFMAEQDWEMAAIYFSAVIDQALPEDIKAWNAIVEEQELEQNNKEQRWLFLELSTSGLINSMINAGDVQGATKYAMHLYNTQRREGFEYSTQLGYPSLLAAAKVLLDAGGVVGGRLSAGGGKWYESAEAAIEAGHKNKRNRIATVDLALRIAQQVVKENPTNFLRLRGQKLIADITSRPGIAVDPAVLYEAAEGMYTAGEYGRALEAFKRVLAALEGKDQATRIELGSKTFMRMARSYQRLDREFEAAMAYREGCISYSGDPEYDRFNATGYYKSMESLLRSAAGDALIKRLYEEAENLAASIGTQDQNQILFDQGERLRKKKEYAAAIAKYEQVQRVGLDYEKAVVYIAVCQWRMGKKGEGYAALVQYLDVFVKDPLNGVDGPKLAKRHDARALAGFYRCLHEFSTKKYADVISSSKDYHVDFEDQSVFSPWVMSMVGNSLAKLNRIAEAKTHLTSLTELYPSSDFVAKLGIDIYKLLSKQRSKASKGDEKYLQLTAEMAGLMELGNVNTSTPSFANLRAESKHWMELSNWDKAVPVLERIISKFGSDPAQEKGLVVYIKPDLAHGYLEQLKVSEAHAILSELMVSLVSKPSKRTLMNYTRSVLGWVQGDAASIQEVPGAGQTVEDFKLATEKLNALGNSVPEKWVCGWYELKFQLAYGYYRWASAEGGPKDSKKKDATRSQLNALVQQLGSDFKGKDGVPGVNASCEDESGGNAALGEDVLRRRLVWLWGKVR